MITKEEYEMALRIVKLYEEQVEIELIPHKVISLGLSNRAYNVLRCVYQDITDTMSGYCNVQITDVSKAVTLSLIENSRNCGKKTLNEIKEAFYSRGIILK